MPLANGVKRYIEIDLDLLSPRGKMLYEGTPVKYREMPGP
jgi:hypothetical protein